MQKITGEMLSELFTTIESVDGPRVVYSSEYMHAEHGTVKHDLYEIVSDVAMNSGMTHTFSYSVMPKVCDALAEVMDGPEFNIDDMHEYIDGLVPIYNSELMTIYENNWSIVDEAHDELGGDCDDSVGRAQLAWYYIMERAAYEIMSKITAYNSK